MALRAMREGQPSRTLPDVYNKEIFGFSWPGSNDMILGQSKGDT